MADRETLDIYNAQAETYATRFAKDEEPDVQLAAFLADLPEAADIWDLGCGPGRSAGLMAAAGHRVTATDASVEMIKLAARHPGVTARVETFDDISGAGVYDGIWANFSLLHATLEDFPQHLAAIAQALKPGGLFHIGMKTGEGMARDPMGRRYIYLSEANLRAHLDAVALNTIRSWHGRAMGLAGVEEPWLVLQARKADA